MLVLSRKNGEKIHIGNHITVTLVQIKGNRVRIGIDAPDDVAILRSELREFDKDVPEEPPCLAIAGSELFAAGSL